MKVTAIAPWAGCKRLQAKRILDACGPHNAWWEPFGGGISLLLVKPRSRVEVINDLHGDVTNLARVVADPKLGAMLYRRLRRVLFCQTLHREAQEALKGVTDPLERAYLYFIKAWMSWGGVAGSRRAANRMSIHYTYNGGHQGKRFHSAVESIPEWRRRLRGVTILTMDAFELLQKIEDAEGTVIYCDPPYLVNKMDYEHDFSSLDHIQLAQALHRFHHSRVVVSYYAHPILDDLYPGWARYETEVTKAIAQIAKRESKRQTATEVLLVNEHVELPLFAGK